MNMNRSHSTRHTLQETTRARGMTLIEMLTVLAVASLVLVAISDSILSLHKTNAAGLETIGEVSSARTGMTSLVQDLREAGYGDDGSYPILSIATSSIVFFSAIPDSTGTSKRQYGLYGTTLMQSIVPPGTSPLYSGVAASSSIAEHVSNNADAIALFRYFDSDGAEITDMSQVSRVRSIAVSVNVSTGSLNPPFKMNATITPRILRNI